MNKVQLAEKELKLAQQEFEKSMIQLQELIDDTGGRIATTVQNVQETIQKPKKLLVHFANQGIRDVDSIVQSFRGFLNESETKLKPTLEDLKADHKTQIGIGILLAGVGLIAFSSQLKNLQNR